MPQLRTIAREYRDMPLKGVVTLLQSPWHEERLPALLIMVGQYARAGAQTRQTIHQLYLRKHVRTMPRTMLRYAIETFPQPLRRRYLSMSHRGGERTVLG